MKTHQWQNRIVYAERSFGNECDDNSTTTGEPNVNQPEYIHNWFKNSHHRSLQRRRRCDRRHPDKHETMYCLLQHTKSHEHKNQYRYTYIDKSVPVWALSILEDLCLFNNNIVTSTYYWLDERNHCTEWSIFEYSIVEWTSDSVHHTRYYGYVFELKFSVKGEILHVLWNKRLPTPLRVSSMPVKLQTPVQIWAASRKLTTYPLTTLSSWVCVC